MCYLVEAASERVLVELEYLKMVEQLARLQKHLQPKLRREELVGRLGVSLKAS